MKKESEQQDRTPESVTDEELDDPKMIADLERDYASKHLRIVTASVEAARKGDRAALQGTLRDGKATEALLLQWVDRLDSRTTPNMRSLQEAFSNMCADIQAALDGGLPGQEPPQDNTEGEGWKHGQ